MSGRLTRLLAISILLASATFLSAGCETSCAAALLTGTLEREGDHLVVRSVDGIGEVEQLRWPDGHSVHEQDGRLVVSDLFGTVKAAERDAVRLGGGETSSGVSAVCGLIEVVPSG
jgi:hypothetical protein